MFHKNKTVYIAKRPGSTWKLPSYVSMSKVGHIENCNFYKLTYKG